jgi:LuxR family maltose regulon positive regulatory protein
LEPGSQRVNPLVLTRHFRLRLAQGDLESASRLAHPWRARLEGQGPPLPLLVAEIVRLNLARLALARGELAQAHRLLAEVAATAGPANRNGRLLEYHLLRARLAQQEQMGAITATAIAACRQALALAQPEGHTLLFREEGPELLPLLQATGRHPETPDRLRHYLQTRLALAWSEDTFRPTGEAVGMVEPLTPRELDVLQHLAAGDSNREIAGKLFITVRTVKKHAGNIYGKLNVQNRTQAAARARELGLLPADD